MLYLVLFANKSPDNAPYIRKTIGPGPFLVMSKRSQRFVQDILKYFYAWQAVL